MTDVTGRSSFLPHAWDGLVLAASILAAFAIPVRLVLDPAAQGLSLGADAALTLLFGADLVFRFRRQGGADRFRWGWVVADLLAALPLARALGLPALGLLRLVKLSCVFSTLRNWRRRTVIHPTAVRLGFFVFWLSLSAHWLACGWIFLGGTMSDPGGNGVYLNALYWCITTLTTVGYGDVTPTNAPQTIYTMFVMLLGVGVYGFVIGNVANLLSKLDSAKTHYVANMERLSGFLRYRRVPTHLQLHIFDYYRHIWENRMGYDETSVLEDLPPTLRRELSLVLKRDLVKKVSFLKDASRELVQDLCVAMRAEVYPPGDVIVQAGEVGRHIYFIGRGSVEIITPDGETVLRTLSDGDFFGELALIHPIRRTATVRAVGYCDLYVLDEETFTRTLERYPDFAQSIRSISEERTVRTDVTSTDDQGGSAS